MTKDSQFELNKGDQFIIGFDISGSMQQTDCPGGTRRFDYVLETMKAFIAEAAKWDPDGVSFYAFNNVVSAYKDVTSVATINDTIATLRPSGGTATHKAIAAAYQEHVEKGSDQTFLMLFTDGEPTDPEAVKTTICNIATAVRDEKEFRISILTVGVRSAGLEQWLTDLDDHLGAKYDIVAVNRLEDVDFESAVARAIDG